VALTYRLFHVKPVTLNGWARKLELRSRWYDLVNQITFDTIFKSHFESIFLLVFYSSYVLR